MSDEVNGNAADKGAENQAPDQGQPEPKQEGSIPKARFDQVVSQRHRAEEVIKNIVAELRDEIPEEYRDLVPDLEPAEQVKWIRTATKKGLFTKPSASGPDAQRPGGKPPTNFDSMSPHDMRAAGYK